MHDERAVGAAGVRVHIVAADRALLKPSAHDAQDLLRRRHACAQARRAPNAASANPGRLAVRSSSTRFLRPTSNAFAAYLKLTFVSCCSKMIQITTFRGLQGGRQCA